MPRPLRIVAVSLIAAILQACSGGGNSSILPRTSARTTTPHVDAHSLSATFTEYPLPAGQSRPLGITLYHGRVWFTAHVGVDNITEGGHITEFPTPALPDGTPVSGIGDRIASQGGFIWYTATFIPREPESFLVRLSNNGTVQMFPLPVADGVPLGVIAGPDNSIWMPFLGFTLSGIVSLVVGAPNFHEVTFENQSVPTDAAAGPDGNMYVTFVEALVPPSDSGVFQISLSGQILNTFGLENLSEPAGIVTGPDGALWITESAANKIVRMTTSGSVTEFPLPTPNAHPTRITVGSDGALWFTEIQANAIGRITTAGVISEFPIPTANSAPSGITGGAHGRIWFTERDAGKVAKLKF
jgi:virginiamycin B lyase